MLRPHDLTEIHSSLGQTSALQVSLITLLFCLCIVKVHYPACHFVKELTEDYIHIPKKVTGNSKGEEREVKS